MILIAILRDKTVDRLWAAACEQITETGALAVKILGTALLTAPSLTNATLQTILIRGTDLRLLAETCWITELLTRARSARSTLINTDRFIADTTWITIIWREADLKLGAKPSL